MSYDARNELLASCSDDTTLRVWSMDTGSCVRTLRGHTKAVYDVQWSPRRSYTTRTLAR